MILLLLIGWMLAAMSKVQGFVMLGKSPAGCCWATQRPTTYSIIPMQDGADHAAAATDDRCFTVLKASAPSSSASSSSASSSSSSTITKSPGPSPNNNNNNNNNPKKKQQGTKKTLSTRRRPRSNSEATKPITEQELIDHVSSLYMRPAEDSDTLQNQQESSSNAHHRLQHFPALILNADYQPVSYLPLSLWNWQEAIKAIFAGKVTVVDVYPDTFVRAARLEIPLPSVMALNEYVHTHTTSTAASSKNSKTNHNNRQPQNPAFTRRNVFLRDGYRCQYCARQFHTRDLSLDHVVPRCHGGRLTWNNAVTSCRPCNGRKGSLLPHQLNSVGMQLLNAPQRPSPHQLAQRAGPLMLPRRHVPPSWKPYLEAVLGGTTSIHHPSE